MLTNMWNRVTRPTTETGTKNVAPSTSTPKTRLPARSTSSLAEWNGAAPTPPQSKAANEFNQ